MSSSSSFNSSMDNRNAAASSSSSFSASSSSSDASSSKVQTGPRRRVIYIGIKRGRVPGVYINQKLAEEQVIDYPSACLRWFSTRYAAEAYVAGWPWKGELIPKNCPYPLREYLNMTYPNPAYQFSGPSNPPRATSPSSSRGEMPGTSAGEGMLSHRASSATLRPPLGDHRNSWRNSMVKAPSPLRHQVDEQGRISVETEKVGTPPGTPKARSPAMSLGRQGGDAVTAAIRDSGEGKVKNKRSSIFGIPTFSRKPSAPAKTTTMQQSSSSDSGWKDLPPPPTRMELRQSRSDPNLPRRPHTSHASSPLNDGKPRPTPSNRQSGLWAAPPPPRPAPPPSAQQTKSGPTFADTTAPAFSRAALRRSGVVMPASAPHIPSSPRRSPSTPSLSPSSSTSSISSVSSTSSSNGSSSKAMMNDFIPPRAGFMRRPSSLSLSSTSSSESIATITTGHTAGMLDKDVGYGQDLIGGGYKAAKAQRVTEGDVHQKKEKEKGMMRGFGKMFGMKKRA